LGVDSQYLFNAFFYSYPSPYNNYQHHISFTATDNLKVQFFSQDSGPTTLDYILTTTQVFRDPSAWYHIVAVWDTTQATASNRVKIYVNGSQVTAFSASSYPTQNLDGYVNAALYHSQGSFLSPPGFPTASNNFDGYLAEVNFIDGQALTPSSFGSTNALTGVWQPARYAGTYGTNGFYLPFTDNSALTTSSNVGLGRDYSGNGNYWTTNNISITAGVTYDSMTDVPTLTSATAANFAVLNPIVPMGGTLVISQGNLNASGTLINGFTVSTFFIPSGGNKYYFEVTVTASGGNGEIGFVNQSANAATDYLGVNTNSIGYYAGGALVYNGAQPAFGSSWTAGDIIAGAFDAATGKIWFAKNNTWQASGSPSTGTNPAATLTWTSFAAALRVYGDTYNINFGQRPFTYTPPTGFVALNTFNLPTSTIVKGNTVMDATLYTGNGSTQTITNAAGFRPDLVWVKSRSAATDHAWYDSVRGTTKQLESNTTTAETTEATGLTTFGSAGFTVGALAQMNTSAATYVGWQWQAGQGSSSSNTNGTITSTVSVNASAGFSVVTYTGTGVAATVGHGLGVAPSMVVVKNRSAGSTNWAVYTSMTGVNNVLFLNTTDASTAVTGKWSGTNSSVFGVNAANDINGSGNTYVAYCWTPIAGYSAFGSFVGNNSGDGPFVYLGFRPKYIMIKSSSNTTDWIVEDSARNPYNVSNSKLSPNTSGAEFTDTNAVGIDFLSNGFKVKGVDASVNASGYTYIYAAFATSPFKNSLAR
jgi:hypothetical protein